MDENKDGSEHELVDLDESDGRTSPTAGRTPHFHRPEAADLNPTDTPSELAGPRSEYLYLAGGFVRGGEESSGRGGGDTGPRGVAKLRFAETLRASIWRTGLE